MRKMLALSLVLLTLFGALAAPAMAVPPDDLVQLAAWFPEETPLFAAVRTDDGFIETLDGVVGTLSAALPPGTLPVSSLSAALDMASSSFAPEGTFQSVFRTWLGSTAAVGILDAESIFRGSGTPAILFAIAITDRDNAIAYLDSVGALFRYAPEERDGAIIYSPLTRMAGQPFYIFRDDVVLIGIEADNVATAGVQAQPLSGTQKFRDAIALLPQSSYNAVIYNDVLALLAASPDFEELLQNDTSGFTDLFAATGPQVYGFTIVNGRELTIDMAVSYTDLEALQRVGGVAIGGIPPVDPAFARYIPAGTPLAILANNAAGAQPIAQLENIVDQLEQSGALTEREVREARSAIVALRAGIRGVTGLEAEEAFSWMNSNVAVTLGLSSTALNAANLNDLNSALPVDFAVIIEATDPSAAAALVSGLTNALRGLDTGEIIVIEQSFDNIPALGVAIKTPDLPFTVELFLASNDEVFVFGTRDAVAFALSPVAGAGLDSDPAYIEALQGVLPDTILIAYAAGEQFTAVTDLVMAQSPNSIDSRNARDLAAILRLISSSSMSSTIFTTDSYSALVRLVWTLPE